MTLADAADNEDRMAQSMRREAQRLEKQAALYRSGQKAREDVADVLDRAGLHHLRSRRWPQCARTRRSALLLARSHGMPLGAVMGRRRGSAGGLRLQLRVERTEA